MGWGEDGVIPKIDTTIHGNIEDRLNFKEEEAIDDDFITVEHIPNSRPSRYVVQIRRFKILDNAHVISQSSEPMGRVEAHDLARRWASWHRLEVR